MTAELEAAFAAQASVGALRPARAAAVAPLYGDNSVLYIKPAPVMVTVPASGIALFDMDGPKTGYAWTVRRISVSDATLVTNTMGSAQGWVFAGQPSPGLALPGNLEWQFPQLPNSANFSSDQLVCQYGEHLIVMVTGGTVGENIICSVAYQLYRQSATAGGRPEVQV
jgi:hypothetical protein